MQEIILDIIKKNPKTLDLDGLKNIKRHFADTHKLDSLPSNIQLLKVYREMVTSKKIKKDIHIEQVLKKRGIRSSSGIVAIQVLTKPYPCPGQCIFCPNDPTMPKSYIKSEPGAMRALLNQFDPTKQVRNRLTSLTLTGHPTDKIEMIVLGGTRDVYPKAYKTNFIKELYDACNHFDKLTITSREDEADQNRFSFNLLGKEKIKKSTSLAEALKKNESAPHRIIGLTIETRPEYVKDSNCAYRRELGVTRIEMGVQCLDDAVLDANKRGHSVQQIRSACHKLRQWGFKFSVHIMPGLYTSSYEKDLKTFQDLYTDPYLKPDEIKFYPTSVIPNTELYNLYKKGKYIPLDTKEIQKLIRETFLHIIPPYTRIKRLIRDIPATEIAAGSNITNLSQLTHELIAKELEKNQKIRASFYQRIYGEYILCKHEKDFFKLEEHPADKTYIIGKAPDLKSLRAFVSLDTRSREIRNKPKGNIHSSNIIIRTYQSSVGTEYFISAEDQLGYIYGFTRLLLPNEGEAMQVKGLGKATAIIRELHVYGQMESLDQESTSKSIQHVGFGRQLMDMAEQIAHHAHYIRLSVISGIGVKAYYRKLGYKGEGTYMVKKIR